MKRVIGLLALLIVLAACAPAAGRPTIPYVATSEQVISALAQIGPQIQPAETFNFYSIEGIGPNYITLASDQVLGAQVLGALFGSGSPTLRLTFTTIQSGEITQMAISGLPRGNTHVESSIDRIIATLDRHLTRAN